jgi:putative flippase GtrA
LSPAASDSLVGQFGRYSFAGIVNTAVGYGIIFGAMALGFSPYVSNLAGYMVGLCCSFLLNKHLVFLGRGSSLCEGGRFLAAFVIAYLLNLGLLHLCLKAGIGHFAAQILAGILYLIAMFLLLRTWVFKK